MKFEIDGKQAEYTWYSIPIAPIERMQRELVHEIENRIEYALRHLVTPVIKGKITKGKIRWRGITLSHIIADGDVYRTEFTPDGLIDNPTYIGHAVLQESRLVRGTVNLEQRGNSIPIAFDSETEEKYQKWLKERS